MKFSIIIPCYNCERTIERALESLERQKYKDFEVIIINDGSKDNTGTVIENFIKKTNLKIRYIAQENAGVSCARNAGIRESRAENITFLDADDEYLEECLFDLNKYVNSQRDIVIAKYVFSNDIKTKRQGQLNARIIKNREDLFAIYKHHKKNHVNFWCCAYKRKILIENNIFFDEQTSYGEDSEFIYKYMYHCNNGGFYLDKEIYIYHVNPFSATHAFDYRVIDNISAHKRVAKYWQKDKNIDKNDLQYIVDRAIWSAAKDLSRTDENNWRCFLSEYPVKKSMQNMTLNADEFSVRILSLIYLISRNAFRYSIRILLK